MMLGKLLSFQESPLSHLKNGDHIILNLLEFYKDFIVFAADNFPRLLLDLYFLFMLFTEYQN